MSLNLDLCASQPNARLEVEGAEMPAPALPMLGRPSRRHRRSRREVRVDVQVPVDDEVDVDVYVLLMEHRIIIGADVDRAEPLLVALEVLL